MIIADYRTNDGTGVETINSLVSKISAIQAQRWRYRHLVQSQTVHDFFVFCFAIMCISILTLWLQDPNSKAGKMAAAVKRNSTPLELVPQVCTCGRYRRI